VGQWLESLNLEQYVEEFLAHGVDGPRLLHLDGAKLKVRGWGGLFCWGPGVPGTPTGSVVEQEVLSTPVGCSTGQEVWVGSRYPNGVLRGTGGLDRF